MSERNLYEVTGDIKDINTLLVSRDEWNRRAQPAQVGQVLTDEEIDAAYEKARADYQRSRFAVRGQQLTAQDSPDWWFARAIEQAVLAKRVPMTDAQIDESMRAKFYPARNRAFIDGVEAAERHHGIVDKKDTPHGS